MIQRKKQNPSKNQEIPTQHHAFYVLLLLAIFMWFGLGGLSV
jgi:hypothetical protein